MGFITKAINFFKQTGESTAGSLAVMTGFAKYALSSGNTITFAEATRQGYKNIVWVHRCISELGQALGAVPWKSYKKRGNNEVLLPDHELTELLERPNAFTTRKEFMETWIAHLSLSGCAYWEVVEVGGRPKFLYPMRPDWAEPVPDKKSYISGYKFMPGGNGMAKPINFKPEEVMWFRYVDPLDEYKGLSPLNAAWRTVQMEDSAIAWNKSMFDNAAVPYGILKIPTPGVQKAAREKLKEEIEKNFSGQNLHRTMVLWGGMEWSKISLDAKEMDFAKLRQLNKFEICAAFGTPPQVVGANEDPTYANYEIARQAYWEDTIIQLLEWMQAKINLYLAPRFGNNIIAKYDISDVPAMRNSFAKKVETAKDLNGMGYPINEINRRLKLGFPDVPWGDIWWGQMNLMPISGPEAPINSPAAGGTEDTPPPVEGEDDTEDVPVSE